MEGAPGLKETALLGHAYRVLHGMHRPEVDVVIVDAPATGHGATLLAAPGLMAQAAEGGQLGEMARDLATYLADASRCGLVLTTLAEEMPVQETLELLQMLGTRLDLRPDLVVVNGLYPAVPEAGPQGAWADLLRARYRMNQEERARLARSWAGPLVDLPLLPLERGPALVAALADTLRGADR